MCHDCKENNILYNKIKTTPQMQQHLPLVENLDVIHHKSEEKQSKLKHKLTSMNLSSYIYTLNWT